MATPDDTTTEGTPGPESGTTPVEATERRGTRAPAWLMLLVVLSLVAAAIAFASWVDTDPTMIAPALGPQEPGGGGGTPATGTASPSTSSAGATSTDPSSGTPSTTTTP